ncbi:carbohydrate ABC transporter permease [Roseinatronobacter alkalisoli]|uniref:Sugar ABC transporter permease n=1 Tax=Roseinatronobacter alkalisoli TaxID=3028235 RepID=A0ABT5TDP7_9RHOB|nr:sugar ABC transporter permease [Roseinatronobacter sp. HJB301]MDD7972287.1 sugar ABC transporter permease [Roseinatronobacter sp. HJB301]
MAASRRDKFTRGWWFILPGLILMAAIVGTPLFMGFRYSLHDVFLYSFHTQNFVGLENYRRAFADPLYVNSLRITAIFTIGCVIISVGMGILIAFLLNARQVKFRAMWMALFLIPFVMTPVVGGIAWRFFIWQQEVGVLNQVLTFFGGPAPYWLLDRETALWATIITNSWHLIPLATLVFYAALTTIPDELHEAGRVDGAGPFQSLWYIVLPMLRPHILFVSIIIITSAFREFDMIWALTGGGPGRSTTVLSIFAYNRGIANQDMGMANTIAFTMFIIMAVVAWLYITLYRKTLGDKA